MRVPAGAGEAVRRAVGAAARRTDEACGAGTRIGGRAATAAVAAALAAACLGSSATPAAHAQPSATRAAAALAATPAKRSPVPATAGLPDSVLARVGATRLITRAAFLRSWRDAHRNAPPDSLTPLSARKFLELLIDRELLAEAASREPWTATAEESAQLEGLADRMAMSMTLDSLLRGAGAPGSQEAAERGVALRDSVVAGLRLELDRPVAERLARAWAALPRPTADSSLAAQLRMIEALPEVPAGDTAKVVARSTAGEVRVHELLDSWRRLPAVYRPRVAGADQVEDLVKNALFERLLRRTAREAGFAHRPAVLAVLERQRENLTIARYLEKRIGRIPPDERAIASWFQAHRALFAVPTRVQVVRMAFETREAASRMAVTLRDAAEADSLAARAERSGIPYRVRIAAANDSALFRAALKAAPGTVVGPLRSLGEWVTARVEAVLPGRDRELSEVRAEVEARWTAEENERRLEALADELGRTTPVAVNEPAIRTVAQRSSSR